MFLQRWLLVEVTPMVAFWGVLAVRGYGFQKRPLATVDSPTFQIEKSESSNHPELNEESCDPELQMILLETPNRTVWTK